MPTPTEVSASLRRHWVHRPGAVVEQSDEDRVLRILREPDEIRPAYKTEYRLADGPAIRVDQSLKRPQITFISGRTSDSRTPRISDDNER